MKTGVRKLGHVLRALALDFGNRDLALLDSARVGTSFAAWCFTIALSVYGFEAHGVLGVGLVALIRLLPGAIASPFAGVLSDRLPRRTVLVASSLAMAAVLAGAANAAAFDAPVAVVFAFPALFAVISSGYAPAESALAASLAQTPQELSAGNVTHSAMENSGFLLAALSSGVLLAATSPAVVLGVAAAITLLTTVALAAIGRDSRPDYSEYEELASLARETSLGFRTLFWHRELRVAAAILVMLVLFEGFADVVVVVVALDLLHLAEGSVGFLNASWGFGALVGGAILGVLFDRGKLVLAIAGGSAVIALATFLPAAWPVALAAYLGWAGIGAGFTFVEVAAKTFLQRLGSDETLGRVVSAMEAARQGAAGVGAMAAVGAIALFDIRGALVVLGLLMPAAIAVCWVRLRSFEVGAPVAEVHFRMLRENSIFSPLPIATLERLSHDFVAEPIPAGEEVIVQGDVGDRFYLIEEGEVEVFEDGVFRRTEGPGESFGEIALMHDVPRTATVRTTVDSRLLVLQRDQFLFAVTGHRRSRQLADTVIDDRWASRETGGGQPA